MFPALAFAAPQQRVRACVEGSRRVVLVDGEQCPRGTPDITRIHRHAQPMLRPIRASHYDPIHRARHRRQAPVLSNLQASSPKKAPAPTQTAALPSAADPIFLPGRSPPSL